MFRNFVGSILFVFVICQPLFAADTRIFYEDSEASSFSEHFLERSYGTGYESYWETFKSLLTRSSTAYEGSYSTAGNPFANGNPQGACGIGVSAYGNTSDFDVSSVSSRYWYFRWRQRWTSGATYSGYNKLIYINYNGAGDFVFVVQKGSGTGFHNELYDADYTLIDNVYPSYSGGSLDDDEWHKVEVFIDIGTSGDANADVWVAIDDILLDSVTGQTFENPVSTYPMVQFAVPSNASAASGSQVTYVDAIEFWTLDDAIDYDDEEPSESADSGSPKTYNAGFSPMVLGGSTPLTLAE